MKVYIARGGPDVQNTPSIWVFSTKKEAEKCALVNKYPDRAPFLVEAYTLLDKFAPQFWQER